MQARELLSKAEQILRTNSPAILTAIGASGTITTAYLAGKASFKAARKIDDRTTVPTKKEAFKLVWRYYIPATVTGGLTIAAIVSATRIGNRRTAALTAAYSLSERALVEYKNKVVETIGETKEQKIRDAIASDKIRDNPPGEEVLLLVGDGNVLCYELHTGRPFVSNMEALKKAENQVNAKILREDYAYLHDFYDYAKIPHTRNDYDFGWTSDKLMELEFTSDLYKDKPVLAFDYNYYKPL